MKSVLHAFRRKNVVYSPIEIVKYGETLSDQVILVSGGGSGIGEAVAKKAIEEQASVIILGRRESKLQGVCKEIGSPRCMYFVYDVTEADGDTTLFDKINEKFNVKITDLVNNAGVYIQKALTDFTVEDFDRTINTNLRAPMFMTMGFIKYCTLNCVKGNVVVTASNRGLFGDYGPYGISKCGIIHYVKGIARELIGSGIRVNAVAPGMTASEINNIDTEGNLFTNFAKGKRVLLPEEIAEVICFLLSNASKCINGAVIACDEGDYLR